MKTVDIHQDYSEIPSDIRTQTLIKSSVCSNSIRALVISYYFVRKAKVGISGKDAVRVASSLFDTQHLGTNSSITLYIHTSQLLESTR